MRKLAERHEKTFIEKYGIASVLDEIEKCTTKNKYLDQVDLYKLLPYLGMLYIPVNKRFRRLLPNDAAFIVDGLCPVKVVSVKEKEAQVYLAKKVLNILEKNDLCREFKYNKETGEVYD